MNELQQGSFEDEDLIRPIEQTGMGFYVAIAILLGVIAFTCYTYIRQIIFGLGVTGLGEPVSWGFYIINFVFFIGISHAGTLISAILRLSKAEWRRPITRMAEVITAIVLAIGGLHPIIDLGRPDRMMHLFTEGRLQSPLLWDVTSITAYFAASTVYLYLPLIPDIAILRDRGTRPRWLYEFLAWGWQGTEHQKKVLERAINILMVMVIPIAVSVHTVISYIFAMTIQPGWHSTIFGPYFVVGAIFSGIAVLLIVMIAFRKAFHLEKYLKEIHFNYLSILLLI
ncbi:MAG: NrfD/PsrC family molybdoenzyme membrane anchor subunit, partial [bacterium]